MVTRIGSRWRYSAGLAGLFLFASGCGPNRVEAPERPLPPSTFEDLKETTQQSYLTLFEQTPELSYRNAQLREMEQFYEGAEEFCVAEYEQKGEQYEDQAAELRAQLDPSESEEHDLLCRIHELRTLERQSRVLADHAIPVAYDNREAKLTLIQEWPRELQEIQQSLESGAYETREFADVQAIGTRGVGRGQREDVEDGREALERMRRRDLLPPEVRNQIVNDYVTDLAEHIAERSDLRVPVKVGVLNAKEINAFALPGGFIFVQRGLLAAAEDEAQLAGVVAHEIAHAAARHGHQLMEEAQIAQVIYQAATIAGLVLTEGAIGPLLRAGYYGLGLTLNLRLLGVSRDFEQEADRLGVQYAWNAGYDPSGFIRFFDKMATRVGYIEGLSWFRTHPPFYERMVDTKREIAFLPDLDDPIVQTSAFERMKDELPKVEQELDEEDREQQRRRRRRRRPRRDPLPPRPEDCPEPERIEYEPGQPIESLCEIPTQPSRTAQWTF